MEERPVFTVTRVSQTVALDRRGNPVNVVRTYFVIGDLMEEYYVDVPENQASPERIREAIVREVTRILDILALEG